MVLGYVAGGTGAVLVYTLYFQVSFYIDVNDAIIRRLSVDNNRDKTLEDIFTSRGIRKTNEFQPKSKYLLKSPIVIDLFSFPLIKKPQLLSIFRLLEKNYLKIMGGFAVKLHFRDHLDYQSTQNTDQKDFKSDILPHKKWFTW